MNTTQYSLVQRMKDLRCGFSWWGSTMLLLKLSEPEPVQTRHSLNSEHVWCVYSVHLLTRYMRPEGHW